MKSHRKGTTAAIALSIVGVIAGCGVSQRSNSTKFVTENAATHAVSATRNSVVPATRVSGPGMIPETIQQKYGEIRNQFRIGNDWVLTTLGNQNSRGVIGIYSCTPKDTARLNGQKYLPLTGWRFYEAPFARGVTLLETKGDTLIIDNGGHQITFNIFTHHFTTQNG